MCHNIAKVKRWGNSLGIVIPRDTIKLLNLKEGEVIDIDIQKKIKVDGFGIFKGAKPFKECLEHDDLI